MKSYCVDGINANNGVRVLYSEFPEWVLYKHILNMK